jgi:hypothetical protein
VRTIQTFILRLLVDPAEPEVLRGTLQLVPEGETQPFVGERELLALLRQLAFATLEASSDRVTESRPVKRETQNGNGEGRH